MTAQIKSLLGLFSVLSVGVLALSFPSLAAAQATEKKYGFLTCDGYYNSPGGDCSFCDLVALANNLIEWLIGILFIIFMIVVVVAGLRLATSAGNVEALQAAKKLITNALIGIIIVFAAWLIVDTVMKALLPTETVGGEEVGTLSKLSSNFGPWNEIQCTQQTELQYFSGSGVQEVNFGEAEVPEGFHRGVTSEGQLTHDEALVRATSNGVIITSTQGEGGVKEDCTGETRCTSAHGARVDTIEQSINIKRACPDCNVVVTGLTEGGHTEGEFSHAQGYKVDIDDNPDLDRFLESRLTRDGSRSGSYGGARYVDSCGNEYVREGSHWDISVTNGSCEL